MRAVLRHLSLLMLVLTLGGAKWLGMGAPVCKMACCAPVEVGSCCQTAIAPIEVKAECPCELRALNDDESLQTAGIMPTPQPDWVALPTPVLYEVSEPLLRPVQVVGVEVVPPRGPPGCFPARAPPFS